MASVLHTASKISAKDKADNEGENETRQMASSKFQDSVKSIRTLATELTETGATLYELLEKEMDTRVSILFKISNIV